MTDHTEEGRVLSTSESLPPQAAPAEQLWKLLHSPSRWVEWCVGVGIFLGGFVLGLVSFRQVPGTPPPTDEPVAAATPALEDQVAGLRATDWFPALVDRVAGEEGFVGEQYADAGGTAAIGYGTNLDTGGITNDQQSVCDVEARPGTVTKAQGRCLLETGLAYRWYLLVGDEPWIGDDLPGVLKAGLLDMAYEVGVAGEERFTETLGAIRGGRYAEAAGHLRESRWYRQEPGRAGVLMGILLAQGGAA